MTNISAKFRTIYPVVTEVLASQHLGEKKKKKKKKKKMNNKKKMSKTTSLTNLFGGLNYYRQGSV